MFETEFKKYKTQVEIEMKLKKNEIHRTLEDYNLL